MRTNHYLGFWADYSRVCHVPDDTKLEPMKLAETIALREEKALPAIGPDYRAEAIEVQNKEWWPTHCEALRPGNRQHPDGRILRFFSSIYAKMTPITASLSKKSVKRTGGLWLPNLA
jgi:hypothetical protein